MYIARPDFERAADTVLLHPEQARQLWEELERCVDVSPAAPPMPVQPTAAALATPARFDLAHLLYYFGALIVLGSMGWFMTTVWESFGGIGICAIATAYAAFFAGAGRYLWSRPETRTPGGILVTLAVGMVPLMIYGLERALASACWKTPATTPIFTSTFAVAGFSWNSGPSRWGCWPSGG